MNDYLSGCPSYLELCDSMLNPFRPFRFNKEEMVVHLSFIIQIQFHQSRSFGAFLVYYHIRSKYSDRAMPVQTE